MLFIINTFVIVYRVDCRDYKDVCTRMRKVWVERIEIKVV